VIDAFGGDGTLYHLLRERFDWLGPDGDDVLLPVVRALHRQRRVRLLERGRLLWILGA
jgi:hypothetical protein